MATIRIFPETKQPRFTAAYRYPDEHDVIEIGKRSGTVLSIYGDHEGITVEFTDRSPPAGLVDFTWDDDHGWLNGAMRQLTQRVGGISMDDHTAEEALVKLLEAEKRR